MPVVTANYSFSFNGVIFGGAGSPYQIQSVDGLEGIPQIRNQDDNRGYADGMFSGQDFLGGRTVSITFLTLASTGNSAQKNFNTIQQALLPQTSGTTPLYFILSNAGTEQLINARVRAFRANVDPNYTYGYIVSQVDFFCPDPKYYDSTLQTGVLAISNPFGRTYNRIYNLVYGGGSIATTTPVTNNGWWTTYPTITLNGPIKNPTLGNVTQGDYITITGTFTNTDVIVINLDSKLVTLNGSSARNLLTGTSNWFSAPPGTSQFYLTGTSTVAGITSATVTWRSAYI